MHTEKKDVQKLWNLNFRKLSLCSKLSKIMSSEGLQGKNLSTILFTASLTYVINFERSDNFDNFFNFNQVEFPKLVLTLNFYKWRWRGYNPCRGVLPCGAPHYYI